MKNSVDTPLNDAQRVWVRFPPPGYNAAGNGIVGAHPVTAWNKRLWPTGVRISGAANSHDLGKRVVLQHGDRH